MIVKQRSRWKFFAVPLFVLLTTLLAACGSASAATSNATSNTSTTAKACLTVTTGTIQSISNNSLSVTNFQGNKVQATFTSQTTIMRLRTLQWPTPAWNWYIWRTRVRLWYSRSRWRTESPDHQWHGQSDQWQFTYCDGHEWQ